MGAVPFLNRQQQKQDNAKHVVKEFPAAIATFAIHRLFFTLSIYCFTLYYSFTICSLSVLTTINLPLLGIYFLITLNKI